MECATVKSLLGAPFTWAESDIRFGCDSLLQFSEELASNMPMTCLFGLHRLYKTPTSASLFISLNGRDRRPTSFCLFASVARCTFVAVCPGCGAGRRASRASSRGRRSCSQVCETTALPKAWLPPWTRSLTWRLLSPRLTAEWEQQSWPGLSSSAHSGNTVMPQAGPGSKQCAPRS